MTLCRGFRNRRSELRVEPAGKYMDRPAVGIVSGVDDELIVEREARPVVQTVRVKGLHPGLTVASAKAFLLGTEHALCGVCL